VKKGAVKKGAVKKGTAKGRLAPFTTAVRGAVAGAVAAVADKLPWTSGEVDAIELLETDHRRMEALLKQGEETTTRGVKTRTELLKTLTRELDAHELIEEKVLYPALQSHPQAKDIVLEGYQEHHVADVLVRELHGLARNSEQWGPKLKVLRESIEHHIQEEEGKMFRTARGIFSREELQQLGGLMARMKADAMRQGK
jgi:hemerythrin-like domain-containing protein